MWTHIANLCKTEMSKGYILSHQSKEDVLLHLNLLCQRNNTSNKMHNTWIMYGPCIQGNHSQMMNKMFKHLLEKIKRQKEIIHY